VIALVSLFILCEGQNVEIRCNFYMYAGLGSYGCRASEFLVSENSTQNIVIVGNHLPNYTNIDVVSTIITDQPFPFIISEFFTSFPNLQTLHIYGGLQEIQGNAFQSADNLQDLSIFTSPVRVLPAFALAGASRLIHFGMVQCENLERIDPNAFIGLNYIDIIDIIATGLRFIPENVFRTLNSLRLIDISDNRIQTIPARLFDNNLMLESIYFLDNNVNAVAKPFVDNFFNLRNLQQFSVTGNSCGNSTYHPSNLNQIHTALEQCYDNYDQRRRFTLDLQGSLVIRDENGNVIFDAYV